jgi:hypothetical protein
MGTPPSSNRRDVLLSASTVGATAAAGCGGRRDSRDVDRSTSSASASPTTTQPQRAPPSGSNVYVLPEHDSVSGSGTPDDPFVSPSGTAGLRELIDEAGGGTVIYAPPGRYDFDSTLNATTSNVSIIGNQHAGTDWKVGSVESEAAAKRTTIFNAVGSRTPNAKMGAIAHFEGEHRAGVKNWTIRNIQFSNTGGVTRAAVSGRRFVKFELRGLAFGDIKAENGWINGWFLDGCFLGRIADWESANVGCTIYATKDLNDLTMQNLMFRAVDTGHEDQGRGAIHITAEDGNVAPRGINIIHPHVGVHGDVGMTVSGLGITVQTPYLEGALNDRDTSETYTGIDLVDPYLVGEDAPEDWDHEWGSDTIRVVGGWFLNATRGIRFNAVDTCQAAFNHFHVQPDRLPGENETVGVEVTPDATNCVVEHNAFVKNSQDVIDDGEGTVRPGGQ